MEKIWNEMYEAQKVTKTPGTRALKSLAPLLTLLQGNIPRSSLACRCKPFCRVQGAAERTACGNFEKI